MDPNPAATEPPPGRVGALQCAVCGTRRELPGIDLRDLHRIAREDGFDGRLVGGGTAIAALCPSCGAMPCPVCGEPYSDHLEADLAKTECTRGRR